MTLAQVLQEMEETSNSFFIQAEQFVEKHSEPEKTVRYYDDVCRNMHHNMAKKWGHVFTIEQIRDVLELVKSGKFPNADYSDDECYLYDLLKNGC